METLPNPALERELEETTQLTERVAVAEAPEVEPTPDVQVVLTEAAPAHVALDTLPKAPATMPEITVEIDHALGMHGSLIAQEQQSLAATLRNARRAA